MSKNKYIYKSAKIIRTVDISYLFPDNCGHTLMRLKDYTANGQNNISPHPTYLKYYANNPYWVQITDEDDFILQIEFNNLSDAQKFFDDFLDNPKEKIKELKQ